jgi:hypothetical protein
MDLKDVLGQGNSSGADGQGGAANKRPKTKEQGGPKGKEVRYQKLKSKMEPMEECNC